jgi:hypothetical protein
VFYTDGSAFSSDDGDPWQAPRRGVQAIACSSPDTGFYWLHGESYYTYEQDAGGWHKANMFTMVDHLLRAARPLVIFGQMLSDAQWRKMWHQCGQHDLIKQGWLSRENDVRREAERHQP